MTERRSESGGKAAAPGPNKLLHSFWIRLLTTLVLTAVLGSHLDLEKIFQILKEFNKPVGLVMFAVNVLLISVFARRWQVIAAGLEFEPPYSLLVRTIWLATFLGQFGPTLLIVETTRFQMLRMHATKTQLIVSQVLDRISGQIVLFVTVLLLFPVYIVQLQETFLKLLLSLTGLFLLTGLVIRFLYRRIRKSLQLGARQAIDFLGWRELPGHYGLSLIIQLLLVLNFSLAAAGLGIRDQLLPLLFMVPLLFATLTILPITVSDWGSRETAAAILLSPSGLDTETIVSISVLYGLFHLLAALPGGLFLIVKPNNATVV